MKRRLSQAVRARGEVGLILRGGSPVLGASAGLWSSHGVGGGVEVGTRIEVEARRRSWEVDSRIRLGVSLGRDFGPASPELKAEVFADPGDRAFERVRVGAGARVDVRAGHRAGVEVRLQRRVDRADPWGTGVRLTYRVEL